MRARCWAYLLVLLVCPAGAIAQNLDLRLEGTQLRVSAPNFRFISGDTLKRLQNGAAVTVTFQLGVHAERTGAPRDLVTTRFVISYDLWEEKFAVTRPGADPRSVSYLSMAAAEKWCMDLLSLPITGMQEQSQFWVTLGYLLEEPVQDSVEENSRLTLGGLIDIFSQRSEPQRSTGKKEITGGPFRLSGLRRNR